MSECQENNHKLTIFVELFRDVFGFLLSSFLEEREKVGGFHTHFGEGSNARKTHSSVSLSRNH